MFLNGDVLIRTRPLLLHVVIQVFKQVFGWLREGDEKPLKARSPHISAMSDLLVKYLDDPHVGQENGPLVGIKSYLDQ